MWEDYRFLAWANDKSTTAISSLSIQGILENILKYVIMEWGIRYLLRTQYGSEPTFGTHKEVKYRNSSTILIVPEGVFVVDFIAIFDDL